MSTWTRFAVALAVLLGALATLRAQPVPQIAYVFPAGMQRGTSEEVTIGGRSLQGVTAAYFARAGITAEVLDRTRPMNGRERVVARETLSKLQEKAKNGTLTSEERAMVKELRLKIAESRKQVSPQLVETVVLRLSAGADVDTGPLDLRLLSDAGLSNPLRFVIGALPERREPDASDAADEPIPLPAVVNGRILARDVDRFRFRVARGARLVAIVEARSLIPFVADAVPGWFQAYLTLRDTDGRVLRTVDDCGSDPDPVLDWVAEADGVCRLEIGDALSRGREDFVYRLTVGELPHVTSVFPLGAQAGQRARAMLRGFNLESMVIEVDLTDEKPGITSIAPAAGGVDPLPFAADNCREVREVEPNEVEPQLLEFPVVVNGIVERPGDVDVFSFKAATGSRLVAEVSARRLGSPVDSLLRLVDSKGRELARCDDDPATATGIATHAADSRLEFVIRSGGVHRVLVSDAQQKGGGEYAYRLYLGPRQPDFTLRVEPSAIALNAGGTEVVTVHVARRDGFAGEIALNLVDAPEGFRLGGAVVPANSDRVDITVTAGDLAQGRIVALALEGIGRVKGRKVRRRAVPCDDRMQAFLNRHLVPAEQLLCVGKRGKRGALPSPRLGKGPLRLQLGRSTNIAVSRASRRAPRNLEFVLRDPPPGISIVDVDTKAAGFVLKLAVERREELRGLCGNLIVDIKRSATAKAEPGRRSRQAPVLGTLPAIPFKIAK